ncbi:estradiol 17-beta-dehydrogenase 8-like isoform X1 [Acyrthosiphon pisum]|uniref:Estradiol 17-beta-dehydrogenase 8 n=1 Tax=Acyrthosiphon pisum TaxID=7029 RepID=A0A8R2H4A7_ACYPI|nr:estradiol 17-beta-dehydrogenase 8-like isoform X1 [Acyrthosiphon pisum]|eukprot:XP_016658847.1 PREDICTED: estradiol 17-beta-dehydrogenase 8-like isoform X1 [Acyrthosiphon pisum]
MLPGKLAFVTGAGGGIGRAICRVMAREGATVVAADLNINNVQTTVDELTGEGHKSYQLDVSNAESVTNVLKQVFTDYSAPPTVVVNAAGITRDNFMLKMSVQDFESVFNVNVKVIEQYKEINVLNSIFYVYLPIELVEKHLPGSIVNIGSIVAQRGNIGQSNYSASKAAVEVFSKTVALEMAKLVQLKFLMSTMILNYIHSEQITDTFSRYNIRCNTVLPGFTTTPMTDMIPENIREHFKSVIPLKRFANSEEIAEVVTFLASEKSSYVTGTSIAVSGGY